MTAVESILRLQRILDKLQERCVYCYYWNIEKKDNDNDDDNDDDDDDYYQFEECRKREKVYKCYIQVKSKIQHQKFAVYWECRSLQ